MSLHIKAKKGEIAENVLLPGDPLRAKWIAETYLENSFCYSEVRGMFGYTGSYKGKPVSVQATGMGIPSAMIYINELIREYEVKNLIRVGSAGSYQKEIELMDIVIAMSASTNSTINKDHFQMDDFAPTANFELFMKAVDHARNNDVNFKAGNILSSDTFYEDDPDTYKKWAKYGVLCVEMETSALYTIAAKFGVNALSILTISDSLITKEELSTEKRETKMGEMIELALECF
ncbi:purine-nucleoside phosphorylase [Christiangramia sp. SM2212]|uniref:Uridine phosphorylase n=1 Tax=Christiangramia sediminicola TaxID=3073267 RepID=A0ABU1EU50_9FLAO|nr:purine-nucleoside phosphorylase [Christiangramia sp. SM2212]MDR5591916.1 purine-nucleoside phosphorylase [Christiangramia sp. SM2212]